MTIFSSIYWQDVHVTTQIGGLNSYDLLAGRTCEKIIPTLLFENSHQIGLELKT